jgi:hypothetical protein
MRQINNDDGSLQIEVTRDELLMMNNALNEVCNGVHIDDWEFATRLGVERSEAQQLLSELNDVLRNTPRDESDGWSADGPD